MIHARTVWCPNRCSFQPGRTPERLKTINLSETHARKGCRFCRCKFDYIRTDTVAGRALRAQNWRKAKQANTTQAKVTPAFERPEKAPPLTAAQRMSKMRAKRKELTV